jgi:hypothetical protein
MSQNQFFTRSILFIISTVLLATSCTNSGQSGDQALAPPPAPTGVSQIPANHQQQGNAFMISTEVFYQGTAQMTSTEGQDISLRLTPDHKAEMNTNPKADTPGFMDSGVWSTLENGNLLLSLQRRGVKDSIQLEFRTDGEKLIYEGDSYGDKGLTMWVRPVPGAE